MPAMLAESGSEIAGPPNRSAGCPAPWCNGADPDDGLVDAAPSLLHELLTAQLIDSTGAPALERAG